MSAPGSKWRLWIQIGVAVVVLAAIFIWSEGLLRRKVGPGDGHGEGGAEWTGRTAAVEAREIPQLLEAVGTVRPVREAAVSARVMGVIDRIEVTEGARVEGGQFLVALSAPELAARSAAAVEAVAGAEAALAQARSDFARMDQLFQREAATRVEWEQARTALSVAEANVARARKAAEGEAAVASYRTLRAPFDGIVIERLMDPGDMAAPGSPILRIVDDRHFRLEAAVEERQGGHIRVGDLVTVVVDALDLSTEARVGEVVPAADPSSRTFLVKADLPEIEGLRPGQFGRIRIPVGKRTALVVPTGAVRNVGGMDLVETVGPDGRLLTQYVRTGLEVEPGWTEVLSGLAEREHVALQGEGSHD